MSRSGVEAKLPWSRVPRPVRRQVEDALGAPVRRGMRIWGGYSPAPSFRLALSDGRRAFLKATFRESTEYSIMALHLEEQVYRELGGLLAGWVPHFYGTVTHEDWHGLLLEDLGPKSVPPWTNTLAKQVTQELARFHRATFGRTLPEWLSRPQTHLAAESWQRVQNKTEDFRQLAVLAGADEARQWLQRVSSRIDSSMTHPILSTEPFALLHGDLRSDNLRIRKGDLTLFDWPAITVGRPEWDMVVFAQTVTVEEGILPEQVMAWYAEEFAVDKVAVECSIAWWLCFFAGRAWRAEIPGLPRVRRFQRQQFGVMAQWAARQWGMPEPQWAAQLL